MSLANVALTNTFDEWRIRTNQLVSEINDINSNSNIKLVSNSSALSVSLGAARRDNVYVDLVISTTTSDTSSSNLASASSVNLLSNIVTSAFIVANSAVKDYSPAFNKANSAYDLASTKFNSAGGTISGNVVITGNLSVDGITTIADGTISTAKLGGDITTAGKALLDDADAAAQRSTLGLGSMSIQNSSNVTITGGTISGTTINPIPGDIIMSGRELSTPSYIGVPGSYLKTDYPLIANVKNFQTIGTTWSGVYSGVNPGTLSNTVVSIAYGNGVWIASIPAGFSNDENGFLTRSTDNGVTWTATYDPYFYADGVAYGNNVWMAAGTKNGGGNGGMIKKSTNGGVNWSQQEFNAYLLYDIAYGNNVWIAVGVHQDDGSRILRSNNDGTTWTGSLDGLGRDRSIASVAYGNNVWLIYVATDNLIMRSNNDGLTWSNTIYGGGPELAYGDGVWISAGGDGVMIRSTDNGLTWSNVNSVFKTTTNITGVAYNGGTWIAVNNEGEMKRSTDNGVIWHSVTSADFNKLFLNGTAFNNEYRSPMFGDIYGTFLPRDALSEIAYANNVWLAGGANGSIWRSVNDSSTLTFLPVFAGDGKFVYTGQ